jgi:hypothetical protein
VEKRVKEEERRKSIDPNEMRRISRKSVGDHDDFTTIGQLTRATVVAEPPPVFAKYMLRKSVDRLNTEVCTIDSFVYCFDEAIYMTIFNIYSILVSCNQRISNSTRGTQRQEARRSH